MPEPIFDTPADPLPPPAEYPLPPAADPKPSIATAVQPPSVADPNYGAILKADTKAAEDYVGNEKAAFLKEKGNSERYQKRMEQQNDAIAAGVNDLKDWDAGKNLGETKVDMWEAFGSPGFIIAQLASAFSGSPMNSALAAGGAAIMALKQGKMDDYNKKFAAWKANSELAQKRIAIEQEVFNNINKLADTNMAEWRVKMEEFGHRFNNERLLALLHNGYDAEVIEAQTGVATAGKLAAEAHETIANHKLMTEEIEAETERQGAKNDPIKHAQIAREIETKWKAVTAAKYGASSNAPQAVALRAFMEEHPHATAEEIQAFLQKGRAIRSPQAVAVSKFLEEHPEATSDDIAQFSAEFGEIQKAEKDFGTGKQGQQLNSLNVGISHVETLRELGDALNNKDITKFNQYAQDWAAATGNPAPTNFDTAKNIVGTEIMKALVAGGGGVEERRTMQDSFNRAQAPEQLNQAMDTAERLLSGQFVGLKKQYEQTTKRDDFGKRLTPEANKVFERFSKQQPNKPAPVPVGAKTKDAPDGTTYKKDGWLWEKQGNQLIPREQVK